MSGVLAALLGGTSAMLNGILTVGNDGGPTNYGFVSGVYGALSPSIYTDHGATSRTIPIWNWTINASGTVGFRLTGVGIANTDTTFASIVLGGRSLLRSASVYTANDGTGHTLWNWTVDTTAYPTSGNVQALVK